MNTDPRVDAYIDRQEDFAKPILERLRQTVHRVIPDAREDLKWGAPHFVVGGRNLAGMGGFKRHARFFLHGKMTPDEQTTWDRFGRLERVDDCPSEAELKKILEPRAKVLREGNAIGRADRTARPLKMPEDFADALRDVPQARQHFDGFTEAQRRDYVEWITSAKRDETRAKRIAQAVEWIAEGKRRNWKYEKC